MRSTEKIKEIMARRAAVIVPGAANAMFARMIEATGFEAVYVTGAGIANMHLGVPDIGLTTMTEVAETLARISDTVSIEERQKSVGKDTWDELERRYRVE